MKHLIFGMGLLFVLKAIPASSQDTTSDDRKNNQRMVIRYNDGKWDTTYVDAKNSAKSEIEQNTEKEVADAMGDFRKEMKELRKELKDIKPRKRSVQKNHFLLDIGSNGFMQANGLNLDGNNSGLRTVNALNRSVGWGFTFSRSENLIAQHLRLMYGLGFEFNNYRLRGDSILAVNGDQVSFAAPANVGLTRNSLHVNWINVPLMLHFTSNPYRQSRAFNVAFGAELAMRMGNLRSIQRYEVGNDVFQEVRTTGPLNAPFLKGSLVARAGYGDLDVFVRYGLTEIFTQRVAGNPNAMPVMAGISFRM
jgi:hypothetical protein